MVKSLLVSLVLLLVTACAPNDVSQVATQGAEQDIEMIKSTLQATAMVSAQGLAQSASASALLGTGTVSDADLETAAAQLHGPGVVVEVSFGVAKVIVTKGSFSASACVYSGSTQATAAPC